MAVEEDSGLHSYPSYPQMIMAAIAALNEKEGSKKSAIAKYISVTYQDLPDSHASLLSAHLASMKESGELLFMKNNYLRVGSNSPPKRGCGRPPKPKPEGAEATAATTASPKLPRPRGRSPMPKDPLAPAVAKPTGGNPRGRGRPPKSARTASDQAQARAGAAAAVAVSVGVKRGRGRPPKAKPAASSEEV